MLYAWLLPHSLLMEFFYKEKLKIGIVCFKPDGQLWLELCWNTDDQWRIRKFRVRYTPLDLFDNLHLVYP